MGIHPGRPGHESYLGYAEWKIEHLRIWKKCDRWVFTLADLAVRVVMWWRWKVIAKASKFKIKLLNVRGGEVVPTNRRLII